MIHNLTVMGFNAGGIALIEQVELTYYKKEALKDILETAENSAVIDNVTEKYVVAYKSWKDAMNALIISLGLPKLDAKFDVSYNVNFKPNEAIIISVSASNDTDPAELNNAINRLVNEGLKNSNILIKEEDVASPIELVAEDQAAPAAEEDEKTLEIKEPVEVIEEEEEKDKDASAEAVEKEEDDGQELTHLDPVG